MICRRRTREGGRGACGPSVCEPWQTKAEAEVQAAADQAKAAAAATAAVATAAAATVAAASGGGRRGKEVALAASAADLTTSLASRRSGRSRLLPRRQRWRSRRRRTRCLVR